MLATIRSTWTQHFPPRPTWTDADIPPGSQKGRIFIVTGGNAGIGFELCKILYASGATIYMASRSQAKAENAIKTIESLPHAGAEHGAIKFLHLDLHDLEVVKKAAATFAKQESKLDVLWNNAGTGGNAVNLTDRTAQGFEPMIGMHCIATLLFTKLLLPQLRAAVAAGEPSKTRVVWTASILADTNSPAHGVDFDRLDKGHNNGLVNYATSKAGTWILGREFARRHGNEGIVSVIMNPGNLKTGVYAGTPWYLMLFINVLLYDTHFGAYPESYAGLSPDIGLENNGTYVIPWGKIRTDKETPRKDLIKAMTPVEEGGLGYGSKLWEWCEEQWKPFV